MKRLKNNHIHYQMRLIEILNSSCSKNEYFGLSAKSNVLISMVNHYSINCLSRYPKPKEVTNPKPPV